MSTTTLQPPAIQEKEHQIVIPVLESSGKAWQRASTHPLLYQINTRAWLTKLSTSLGRPATFDDISDRDLDRLAINGFDYVWFLGVWQIGAAGRKVSVENEQWQREFQELLPDYRDDDVCGSCFAIRSYAVNAEFGGNFALDRLRDRLRQRGLRLILDFVPNHTAPDHPWVQQHPDFYVQGTEEQLASQPQNYTRVMTGDGPAVLAYGRDPYFAGWPDTLQLNYANPRCQQQMTWELQQVAGMCDGVRCDMAMLILPDVFERTWGLRPAPFWPQAIERVRERNPGFLFMAEVYWDLEWTLQQQGFDYTYDKRLYDRLRDGHARPVRDHFRADFDFQCRSARFLENHDEPRAAATFSWEMHQPAAVLTYLCPGLRFFHQGQAEGLTKKTPVHLRRGPTEPVNPSVQEFYERLLSCLRYPETREGKWQLLECTPAWDGNWTWDCFVGFAWQDSRGISLVAVVNFAPNQSQCRLQIPFENFRGKTLRLRDLMGPAVYERNGDEILSRGLYLDLPAWGYHVFDLTAVD